MPIARRWTWALLSFAATSTVQAQSSDSIVMLTSGGHHSHHQSSQSTYTFNPNIYYGYAPNGPYAYSPPLVVIAPGGQFPVGPGFGQVQPGGMGPGPGPGAGRGGGLMLPMPPRPPFNANPPQVAAARRGNPTRAREQVVIGDRSFRTGNIKRAEEKYLLATKADPSAPMPHVHLAQVSIARGNYSAAADHLRDAVTVAPNGDWLVNAPDIQSIFGEPADFARQISRIESHLQTNPGDRDAWFVLGAEYYLSGRTRQASGVFQRLTDRRPDEALTAFIDASKTQVPAAAN